jgi:hypothetical protein
MRKVWALFLFLCVVLVLIGCKDDTEERGEAVTVFHDIIDGLGYYGAIDTFYSKKQVGEYALGTGSFVIVFDNVMGAGSFDKESSGTIEIYYEEKFFSKSVVCTYMEVVYLDREREEYIEVEFGEYQGDHEYAMEIKANELADMLYLLNPDDIRYVLAEMDLIGKRGD